MQRRQRFIADQRWDLPQYNNMLELIEQVFQSYNTGLISSVNKIVKNWEIQNAGGLNINVNISNGDSVLLNPERIGNEDLHHRKSTEAQLTLSLADNTVNYVEVQIFEQTGASDTVAIWDPTANSADGEEFTQTVDTCLEQESRLVSNTVAFSGDADKLPLAEVTTSGGGITLITDSRDFMFHLETDFVFGAPRTDIDSVHTIKEMFDALTTRIRELSGLPDWYTDGAGSGLGSFALLERMNTSLIDGGKLSWVTGTGTATWAADLRVIVPGRAFNYTISAQSVASIADGEVIYVTLPDVGVAPGGPLTVSKSTSAAYPISALADRNYILGYRSGTKLYFGNGWQGVELEDGESIELGDGITDAMLTLLGSVDENSTDLAFTSSIVIGAADSVRVAVSKLDVGLGALTVLTTAGDMIIRNGGNTTARLPIGSNGQALEVVAGVPAWVAGSGSPDEVSLELDEDMTVGDAAVLVDDGGTAKIQRNALVETDDSTEFLANAMSEYSVAPIGDNKYIIAFIDDSDSGRVKVIVGEKIGHIIGTIGTAVDITTVASTNPQIAKMGTDRFIVAYVKDGDSEMFATAGTVSGTTPTLGAEVSISTLDVFTDSGEVRPLGTDKFVASYRDGGALTLRAGTISGSPAPTIALGTGHTDVAVPAGSFSIDTYGTDTVLVAVRASGVLNTVQAHEVDGSANVQANSTVATFKDTATVAGQKIGVSFLPGSAQKHFVLSYPNDADDTILMVTGTVSDAFEPLIGLNDEYLVDTSGATGLGGSVAVAGMNESQFVITFLDGDTASPDFKAFCGEIDDHGIFDYAPDTAVAIDASGGTLDISPLDVGRNQIADFGDSFVVVYPYSASGRVVAGLVSDTFGILQETGTAGESKPITKLSGISNIHSGLSIAVKYYLQFDGTFGTTKEFRFIGVAKSATEILFDPDNYRPPRLSLPIVELNEWQDKVLVSPTTANAFTLSDLTFSNLVIGRLYKVFLQASFSDANEGTMAVRIRHNGVSLGQVKYGFEISGTTTIDFRLKVSSTSAIFVAAATTVTFLTTHTGSGTETVLGGSSKEHTWSRLEVLNNYSPTESTKY